MSKREDELRREEIGISGTRKDTKTPGGEGVNPFRKGAGESTGGVNPSGPTTGTEGWGIGVGEANTTGVGQGALGKRPQHTEARRAEGQQPDTENSSDDSAE